MFLPTGQVDGNKKGRMEAEGPLSLLHRSVHNMTPVLVGLRNNRKVIGRVLAYDRHYNLLLSSAKEVGVVSSMNKGKKKKEEHEFSRELGNMFIRGDSVILVTTACVDRE